MGDEKSREGDRFELSGLPDACEVLNFNLYALRALGTLMAGCCDWGEFDYFLEDDIQEFSAGMHFKWKFKQSIREIAEIRELVAKQLGPSEGPNYLAKLLLAIKKIEKFGVPRVEADREPIGPSVEEKTTTLFKKGNLVLIYDESHVSTWRLIRKDGDPSLYVKDKGGVKIIVTVHERKSEIKHLDGRNTVF